MTELNTLIVDGVSLCRAGVFIFPDYVNEDSPEKEQTTTDVPGRHGSLLMKDYRYKNQTIGYHFIVFKKQHNEDYYEWVKALLLEKTGYSRIEDSANKDIFRKARCTKISRAAVYYDAVKFAVEFDAMPQKWLKTGEPSLEIQNGAKFYNQTQFYAYPLIEVTGSGTLTVGNESVKCGQSMIIDCEAQDCYGNNGENLNSQITLNGAEFPTLPPGETGVNFTGFSKVAIAPRWWTL